MISVKNVIKYYGDYKALKDISFDVKKGEIIGFLGPNGAGKTTTMRILTGYIPATSGNVYIDNYEIHENPREAKKLIGYMPENISLYTDMRITDYLNFCAHLKNINKRIIKKRIDAVIEIIGLGEYRNHIIGHLSKGYRQRVGLAQSILHEPQILILDEPTVGLDPTQIIEIRKLIKSLSGERTVILSTHILSEVEETCEKVLIIDRGELIAENMIYALKKTVDNEINSGNVKLLVRDRASEAVDVLRAMPGIRFVNMNEMEDISITTESEYDIRPAIISKLVELDFEILEMKAKELSLEEVFLHFTKKSKEKRKAEEKEKENITG